MLADVFSSLDGFHWRLWGLPLASLIFLSRYFWAARSVLRCFLAPLTGVIREQTQRTRGSWLGGTESTIVTLFLLILLFNWSGIIPYVFSATSHLVVTLSLGLVAWLALVLSSFTWNVRSRLAALAPSGAPRGLIPFLVLVETLRMLIRPLTLSVRLAANIRAGHLIIGLAGSYICLSRTVVLFQVLYCLFELGVCLVQRYVFALLLTLYSDEHA